MFKNLSAKWIEIAIENSGHTSPFRGQIKTSKATK